jgi:hypothetical protein
VKRDFYSAVDPMAAEAPAKKPCCTFGCFGGYAMNKRNVRRSEIHARRLQARSAERAASASPCRSKRSAAGGPGYFSRAIAPAVVTGTP